MSKIALVTGANKGIGLETARQLSQKGVTVLAGARDLPKASGTAELLKAEGLDVRPLVLDVANNEQIREGARRIEAEFGKLDILINNAAVFLEGGWASNADTVPVKVIRETFDINFFGLIEVTQALLPLLRKSEAGRIVNLSSIMGSLGTHSNPKAPIYDAKPLAYDASKTAVNAFTVHLAHALRETPIKVNAAHPGWVKTDMGGDAAPLDTVVGAQTTVELALLGPDGPTGGYFHLGKTLPW
jgi:NAD(P)-dependent dehydrogenase (short-subunit alcohol dehydrogenase family)